jgi:GPR1/FUN34/yaaH family
VGWDGASGFNVLAFFHLTVITYVQWQFLLHRSGAAYSHHNFRMDFRQLLRLPSHVTPPQTYLVLTDRGAFAAFFLSFGVLVDPEWGIAAAYSTTGSAADGASSHGYNVALGFYLIFWGIVVFLLLVGSTRTNLIFVFVFVTLDIGIFVLSGAFFKAAAGDSSLAGRLQKVRLHQGSY